MSWTGTETRHAPNKSLAKNGLLILINFILLQFLTSCSDFYPINYVLLLPWIYALFLCIRQACLLIFLHQDKADLVNTEDFIKAVSEEANEVKYIWSISNSDQKYLNRSGHQQSLLKAGILAAALSCCLILSGHDTVAGILNMDYFIAHLTRFRTFVLCVWLYMMISGLRFGGFKITEGSHR